MIQTKTLEPHSYWVKIGHTIVRRNRKHLRPMSDLGENVENDSCTNGDSRIL